MDCAFIRHGDPPKCRVRREGCVTVGVEVRHLRAYEASRRGPDRKMLEHVIIAGNEHSAPAMQEMSHAHMIKRRISFYDDI